MKTTLKLGFRLFIIGIILLTGITGVWAQEKIAIIDAGSSGSRLYVYSVTKDSVYLLFPKNQKEITASKGRALSTVPAIKDSVEQYIKTMTGKYHEHSKNIPLYVLATAGMRLEDENKANNIYEFIKELKVCNKYDIKNAMTISGRYEALYAWISLNYKKGNLGFSISTSQKPLTFTSSNAVGIIEIGGASIQFAYLAERPNTISQDHIINRKGFSNLYCRSYLNGGVDRIFDNFKENDKPDYSSIVPGHPDIKTMKNKKFYALGKPLNIALENVGSNKKYKDFTDYINNIKGTDTKENYHPKSNARYIQYLIGNTVPSNLMQYTEDISWTLGAAIDIIINGIQPEVFDYKKKN